MSGENSPVVQTPREVAAENAAKLAEAAQQRRVDYNRLVRTARLENLILEKVDFKIAPEALGIKENLLARTLAPSVKIMSYGQNDNTCVANIIWDVTIKFKTKAVVKCRASYIVSYEGEHVKNSSDEVIGLFLEHVGKVATYAYFRALYAQLDWAANLHSQPLPVLQLQPKV